MSWRRRPRPRDRFRREHSVRPATDAEEGCATARLPNGVYGFTYAPLTESPVFAKHHHGSFEVHKSAAATEYLIGFVSAADIARLEGASGAAEIRLYPQEYEHATELVSLDASRLTAKKRQP